MSVNGAAIGKNGKINFCDFDGVKKKELERRKKLRLEQVRTQSKELSMQIRDRVAREKHRQLRKVEETKKKELLSWKEQHVNNTMADYYYCLSNVGDAHVAAERENELTERLDEQQRKNRKTAAIRGRDALEKERLKNVKKTAKSKPKASFVHKSAVSAPPQEKILSKDDVILVNESDDEMTDGNDEPTHDSTLASPVKSLFEPVEKQQDLVRFSQVSDLIEERRRARNLCDQILENASSINQPETASKSPERRTKSPQAKPSYAPRPLNAPKSPKLTKSPVPKAPVNVKGGKPQLQPFSLVDKATYGNQSNKSQRNAVAKKVNTPNKVVKSKNSVSPAKFDAPHRREFVPRFTKNPITKPGILKNKAAPVITKAVTTESPEKVQFYDHFTRRGKEHDPVPGMVIRESHRQTIDANEAARVQNEMDEIRFQQMQELKKKSEQRAKESLQKNQVRKDYENLTKQLDELCKEENRRRTFATPNEQFSEERISQLARNRQQSMNRAFEDIHQKPVVITCPPFSSNQDSSSSDVNVATSPTSDKQAQRIDPFDSSDSCTSILLGYVDNRSRKLVKDIKQCKDDPDGDKRKKLVTLLTRLDHLRKLLMEEIVRNSSLNLEPFYRSVLEVETEKKEILHDPDANKENSDLKKRAELLKKREHTVKSKEMKLDKKIADLFLKQQEQGTDNTFESLTSETISSTLDPEPVKILIEVKNAGNVRKVRKSHVSRTVQTSSHVVGPKHKTSVGSSASTAYRSPPPTFQTDFTKVLSNQPTAKPTKPSYNQATMTKPVEQTALAHYITRLLGMSQKSVDQLGVSASSSVATPTGSVIEVATNMSATVIDRNHLDRVQMKINENLQFSREVDDSFKQVKSQAEKTKKVLDVKQQEAQLVKELQKQTKGRVESQEIQPKNLRSDVISKTPEKSKKMTNKVKPPKSDSAGHGHNVQHEVVIEPKIPENSKRIIADLTKQIEQVRQDKQKLLEKTLSSAHSSSHSSSGKDFDSTQYKDFVPLSNSKSKPSPTDETNCSSQASDVVSLPGHFIDEESKNLINTKRIGISFSRDSGIGSSRPVTSTDFRISPDIKQTERIALLQTTSVKNTDLPEKSDPSAGPADAQGKSVESGPNRKSGKPPISLKRYNSPQLVTEPLQPHDLSTINEVETSAASRLNQSTRNDNTDSSVPAPYTKFPTFVEYKKMQEVTSIDSSSDGEKSYSETVLKKMLDVTCLSETDLNYRKLEKYQPMSNTNEKSTNTEMESEYIDVEKEIRQRRLLQTDDVLSSTNSISKTTSSTSTSSDLLGKDFNQIGLNWATAMLKKTSTAQNLESSSSSIKSFVATQNKLIGGGSSPDDRINGNPLNIRDFLQRELLKRSQLSVSSSMSDTSTLTDQFLKSLLTISSNSSHLNQATLRTSTPNRCNLSSESEKFIAAHDIGHSPKDEHIFSGESILSSVRGVSQSETSARETSE